MLGICKSDGHRKQNFDNVDHNGDNMLERVKEIIEKEIRPALAVDGGLIKLLDAKDGVVKEMLGGACAVCPMG